MTELLNRMKAAGSIKAAEILSNSIFFNEKDIIPTQLPILNIAFSGKIDGGLVPGLTVLGGASKSFKSLTGLYCMKAYLDKYDDAVALFFDSEFGTTPEYMRSMSIDVNRVLHIPIEHIEQLKFDIVKRLEKVNRGDHIFILIDSIGALPSKKEVEDALDEKAVADMTRAKAIRSLLRIITPHLTMKDIPCIVIAHTYSTMELYSKQVVGGGTSIYYASNQIFLISRSQEKDGTEIIGWNFTINIEKSRFVKEKSKLPFLVTYEGGISKYSGLLELALEAGLVQKPSAVRYARVDPNTGLIEDRKWKLKDTNSKEFWEPILKSKTFQDWVQNKYQIASGSILSNEEIDHDMVDVDDEDL